MGYSIRLLLLILEFSFLLSRIQAQVVEYDQYTSEEGLSENVVYCLHQDDRGFIWAGTDFGLNKFDGYSFRQFHRINSDTNTLSQSTIETIYAAKNGTIWIGTNGGLNRFDLKTGIVERMPMPGIGTRYSVSNITELHNGDLLIVSSPWNAYRFNPVRKTFIEIEVPGAMSKNVVFDFFEHGKGVFILHKDRQGAIALFNELNSSFEVHPNHKVFSFAPAAFWDFYFRDKSGNHFLASSTNRFFNIYNPDGQLICSAPHEILNHPMSLYVTAMTEMNEHETWIGTNHGLLIYDAKTKMIMHKQLTGDSKSLPGNKEIRSILKDRNGYAWLGTFGEGLLKCNNKPGPFRNISIQEISQNKLGRMIFGVYPWSDGMLAVETTYGNLSLIQDNRVIRTIGVEELTLDQLVIMSTSNPATSLSAFQQKRLEELERIYGNIEPHLMYFPDDTTIIDAGRALYIYTPSNNRQFEIAANKIITDEKYHWIASYDGLHRVDKISFTDTLYQHVEGDSSSLSETYLYHMVPDVDNNFWIGTKGGGLNYFQKDENRFIHYTTEDGLPDNVVYFLLPDDSGHLWLTTNKGISRLDLQKRSFSNYNRRDGLLNTEFNKHGGIRLPNGVIYFSGTSGLDSFHPDVVDSIRTVGEVHITEWSINESKQTKPGASFSYDENNISVHFTTNDFVRPDLIYFRYRISPDQPWTRVQGSNSARYSAIQPGHYTFEVQASHDSLYWSESASIPFFIRTPWWRSWWFFALSGVIAIAAFYAFYRFRVEQLKRLQSMRSRISRDLHDEVGSTLSSIHVYSSVAEKAMEKNPDAALDALRQIHHNSRQVMENMSDIVWAINTGQKGEISLEKKLKNFGFELLTPLGIETRYRIEPDAEKRLQHIEARKNILLIAKEAMNNIARYSKATEAIIDLDINGQHLDLQITDNGIGFEEDSGRKGNGLHNMQKRTESMGGKFRLETKKDKGTMITCSIPVASISDGWYPQGT